MAETSAITPHISSLPAELLQQIFLEALSSHALLFVSRRISALYAPYRFRDVAVSGKEQITALLSALDAADPPDVCVERLFMSDRAREEAHNNDGTRARYRDEDGWNFPAGPYATRLFAGILRHAAPHARAICLLSFNQEYVQSLQCLSGLSFPALRRLALRPQRSVSGLSGDWAMPALQTLVLPELIATDVRWTTRSVVGILRMCAAQLAAVTIVDVNVDARAISSGAVAFAMRERPQILLEGRSGDVVWGDEGLRLRLEIRRDTSAQPGQPETNGTPEGVNGSWDGWRWEFLSDDDKGLLSYDQWRAAHEVE